MHPGGRLQRSDTGHREHVRQPTRARQAHRQRQLHGRSCSARPGSGPGTSRSHSCLGSGQRLRRDAVQRGRRRQPRGREAVRRPGLRHGRHRPGSLRVPDEGTGRAARALPSASLAVRVKGVSARLRSCATSDPRTSRSGREHAAHAHLCCARIIAPGSPTTSSIERSRLPPTQTERSRSSSDSAVTVPMLLNRWSSPIATASLCWVTPSGARYSPARTSTGDACQSQTEECRHSHGHLILRRDPRRRPWP